MMDNNNLLIKTTMTELKLKTHSVVDVITNSSTCIYTQARKGSIDTVKDIVNTLLKLGESDLTADDLFTFEITADELDEQRRELLDDNGILEEYVGREISWRDNDFKEKMGELFSKIVAGEYPKPDFWEYGYGSEDYGHECDTEILVTAKVDNENAKLAASLLSSLDTLFSAEERSC
jgi:hypothetical protein